MLVIRLLRTGKKNQPSFKIVVVEKTRSSTSGSFIEQVGFYNPLTKERVLKQDRIKYWISVGAKPLETVHNLLVSEKIIEGKKIDVHNNPKKKEGDAAEAAKPAETPAEAVKPAEVPAEQVPAEAPKEVVKEESLKEEAKEEATPEVSPSEEKKEEAAAHEVPSKEEKAEAESPKEEVVEPVALKEESSKPEEKQEK